MQRNLVAQCSPIILLVALAANVQAQVNVIRDCPGVRGDGISDDYGALQACLDTNAGRHIVISKTQIVDSSGNHPDYFISQALHMRGYEQWLDGEVGTGAAYGGVQISCAQGGVEASQDEGVHGPRISNLYFRGANSYAPGANGIHLSANGALITNVAIYHFGQYGVLIDSMTATSNANMFHLEDMKITFNGSDGIRIIGQNTNAGLTERMDVENNGGWGINDQSFLGNTHIQPHASYNALGDYNSHGNPQRTVWINPYSEGGSPISHFMGGNMVINGVLGSGFDANDGGYVYQPGQYIGNNYLFQGPAGGNQSIRQAADGSKIWNWADGKNRAQWTLAANATSWVLKDGAGWPYYLSINKQLYGGIDLASNAQYGAIRFNRYSTFPGPVEYWSGGPNSVRTAQVDAAGNGTFSALMGTQPSQPTTPCSNAQYVFNSAPSVGASAGWVCIAGTWHPFGIIQ